MTTDLYSKLLHALTQVGRYEPSATAMFDFSRERTLRSVDESLQRLGVDYIDTVQVHDPEFAPSLDVVLRETLPALEELRASGKIRCIGITGYPLSALRELAARAPAAGVRVDTAVTYCRFNMFCKDLVTSGTLAELRKAGIAVINAAPLAMGLLTTRGPPSWHPALPALKARCAAAASAATAMQLDVSRLALAFCLDASSQEGIATTLVSMGSVAEVKANVGAANGTLALTAVERSALATLQTQFFSAPVPSAVPGAPDAPFQSIATWEGVEVDNYWAKLGASTSSASWV